MAMIGRRAAIAEMGEHRNELHGPIAFNAWLGAHAWLLRTTRARIEAFMDWAWDSFARNRDHAIIVRADVLCIEWDDEQDHTESERGNPPSEPEGTS